MKNQNDELKLENQLCFQFYVCSRAMSRYYRPFMDEMGLTYTQYLTMLVLWEEREINVKSLGERLYLDSGTLTPVLKRLEEKGYVSRERSAEDERNLVVCVTEKGEELKKPVFEIYRRMESWKPLPEPDCRRISAMFREVIDNLNRKAEEREIDQAK